MRVKNFGLSLLVPVVFVAVWWFASAQWNSIFFPPLQTIMQTFSDTWLFDRFFSDIVPSLRRLFLGYALAVVVGVALGVLLGRVRVVDVALQPAIQFARAIPAVALIPVAIIILGIGDAAKISLIVFVCVFPILLNTIDGVRNVESALEDVGRAFRLTAWQRATAIQLPSAMPQIFAGMRTSLGFAFILGILTEMTGATNGIGFITIEAQQTFDLPQMWSGMILLGVIGSGMNALFMLLERRVLRWNYQSKEVV